MLKDDRNAWTGRTDDLAVDQDLARAWREQPADTAEQRCLAAAGRTDYAENLIASYVQLNVAKGDDCSFEEKLAGAINDDLGAISHRKAYCEPVCRSISLTRRTLPRHRQPVKLPEVG